eukprot:gene18073-24496_t
MEEAAPVEEKKTIRKKGEEEEETKSVLKTKSPPPPTPTPVAAPSSSSTKAAAKSRAPKPSPADLDAAKAAADFEAGYPDDPFAPLSLGTAPQELEGQGGAGRGPPALEKGGFLQGQGGFMDFKSEMGFDDPALGFGVDDMFGDDLGWDDEDDDLLLMEDLDDIPGAEGSSFWDGGEEKESEWGGYMEGAGPDMEMDFGVPALPSSLGPPGGGSGITSQYQGGGLDRGVTSNKEGEEAEGTMDPPQGTKVEPTESFRNADMFPVTVQG